MEFFPLSLPEAAYFYTGLSIQALTRSLLVILPRLIVTVNVVRLLARLPSDHRPYLWPVISYFMLSVGLMIAFWPETILLTGGRGGQTAVASSQVQSFAARQSGAQVVNAAQTGLVPPSLEGSALVPQGSGLILSALTETSLGMARLINRETHRPFASIVPMQWLLTRKVSSEVKAGILDFVQACYLPAKARLFTGTTAAPLSFQDLLPWEGSPLAQVLATIQLKPGMQTGLVGLTFESLRGTTGTIDCATYATHVQQAALAWLAREQTEAGTPLATVYLQELQLPPLTVARFMIYQEMLRAAGPEIPAPSLTGTYLALRGAGLLGHILGGANTGSAGGLKGAGLGALAGLGRGIGNEISQVIDGVSAFLKPAVFLIWWAPYIFGVINMVLLGLFPLVLLWSLTPGQQFRPLLIFFAVLFVTTGTPLWWALVDVAARLGGTLGDTLMNTPTQWLNGVAIRLVVTVTGIFTVLAAMSGMVLWTGFSAARGVFRAAVA